MMKNRDSYPPRCKIEEGFKTKLLATMISKRKMDDNLVYVKRLTCTKRSTFPCTQIPEDL